MPTLGALALLAAMSAGVALDTPRPGGDDGAASIDEAAASIDGLVGGKPVRPDPQSAIVGAEAAVKLMAASNLTDFLNPGQPIDKVVWRQQVAGGIADKRPHLLVKFAKPRQFTTRLNGAKSKINVSEVVFFEPTNGGPVCLWARDGEKHYFANQIEGREDLVKWLAKVQGK